MIEHDYMRIFQLSDLQAISGYPLAMQKHYCQPYILCALRERTNRRKEILQGFRKEIYGTLTLIIL